MSTNRSRTDLSQQPPAARPAGSAGPAGLTGPAGSTGQAGSAGPKGLGPAGRSAETPTGSGYWYDDLTDVEDDVVDLLRAVRRFRRADQEMRRRLSADMDMNETDLRAIQLVIEAESRGDHLTPRELARHLAISTASTTKLLDRLTASGHLARAPHPSDRRSLILASTPAAHAEVRDRLTRMHERMAQIARSVPVASRADVVAFLDALVAELDLEGAGSATSPAVRHTPASKVPSSPSSV